MKLSRKEHKSQQVKVKPKKLTPNKFKLTPDVNKLLKEIAVTLPEIPNFIKMGNTYHPQKIAVSKIATRAELMEQGIKEVKGGNGKGIDEKSKYVQHGTSVRFINHKVNLIGIYQIHGMPGIEDYKKDVTIIYNQINKPQSTKENQLETEKQIKG
jgi:hypothetical protein